MVGETIQHYQVLEKLGGGGMGVVYKARDVRLGRLVALKFLSENRLQGGHLRRFRREARAASALNHPNICAIYDIGDHEGRPFIVMEFLAGQTLAEKIQSGPLAEDELLALCIQLTDGLEAAHSKGVVHRDIKPSNIVLTEDHQVKILDFGIAKLEHEEAEDPSSKTALTIVGSLVGTVHYMSPEQALGQPVDARSDLFSLGVVLYEMATGIRPFSGKSTVSVVNSIINTPAAPARKANPDLPRGFGRILERLLAKKPEDRYGSAGEVREDLKQLSQRSAAATVVGAEAKPKVSTSVFVLLLAALLSLVAIVLAFWFAGLPKTERIQSLALLPLEYRGRPDRANLANMFPALLIESLRLRPDLAVAPFDTSRAYAANEEPALVATELGVDWVLKGVLTTDVQGYEVRLNLVGKDQAEIWNRDLSGNVGDFFGVAEETAKELSEALGATVDPKTLPIARNTAAVESYLQGRTALEGWDMESNYEEARRAFSEAVELDKTFGEAHAGLALAIWKTWQSTREPQLVNLAMQEAEKAVALAPNHPESHLALGVVQLGRGRTTEAISSFEEARRLAPADDGVVRSIAQTYSSLGRIEEAEKMYDDAVRLRPDFWENHLAKGNFLLAQGRYREAQQAYRKVIGLRPESDIGHNNLALTHLFLGEMEEAEVHLHAALAIQPNTAGRTNLGFIYYSMGRFSDAAQQFEMATQLSPGEVEPWINLGDAYRQLGQGPEALEAYLHAVPIVRNRLAVNPGEPVDRAMLAYALAGTEQCPKAMEEATRAAREGPETPIIHYYAAVAAVLCRAEQEAIAYVVRAIELGLVADIQTNPDLKPLLARDPVKRALTSRQ